MNVAGIVRFEDTDEPTVAQNGGTGLYEIQSNDYGAFRFDGGGYIEGDTVFNSDVFINGVLNQRDSATESFGNRNYLNIDINYVLVQVQRILLHMHLIIPLT